MKNCIRLFSVSAVLFGCVFAPHAFAQEEPAAVVETAETLSTAESASDEIITEETANEIPASAGINPNDIPSVLFTYWEHSAIKDVRRVRAQGGFVRGVSESELMKELETKKEEIRVKPPPEERDISLGGIVYVRSDDWTIWLNGKRITPNALPEEVIDLRVYKDYIELKWFDAWSNQIFPIRLRSHQRFNIDSRIFLPG